ncbi:hypothetical protein EC973_007947 [Apophysomyces ossiformis]|uniref:Uncharacterized protein n=1 Tax=Apophysomyces ossiformis TaxID=679940 RepID=A0A8H7BUF9_9FUNG|nr:hypothetical protein EC973_007947 [Apophysomyces ossiformis]
MARKSKQQFLTKPSQIQPQRQKIAVHALFKMFGIPSSVYPFQQSMVSGFEFQRMLTDCILLMDKEDVNKVKSVLQSKGLSFQRVLRQQKAWVQARNRRFISPASQLIHSVYKVLMTFGPLKCSATGQALFNGQAWKEAANFLELVAKGYLSEPSETPYITQNAGIQMGLPVYRCIRGTNSVEGGVHQILIRRFGTYNATPRFACNLMTEYKTRHNLDICVLAI